LRGEELRLAREQDARPMLIQIHEYLLVIREQVVRKVARENKLVWVFLHYAK
jgi:hypothetical protein